VGNGEQRFNARGLVEAGGGLLVDDAAFLPPFVESELLPLLRDGDRRDAMAAAAATTGVRDGADRMVDLLLAGR
jgi:UDP-N-acetylglucosamine--N-acetylmuramyl-(pentapeptide) pyrophosphoryl-undecaprenol N-acetylglucosamine transferase